MHSDCCLFSSFFELERDGDGSKSEGADRDHYCTMDIIWKYGGELDQAYHFRSRGEISGCNDIKTLSLVELWLAPSMILMD